MSKPSASTKPKTSKPRSPKRPAGSFVCLECGQTRSPLEFPSLSAPVCTPCLNKPPPEPESPPVDDVLPPPSDADGDIFRSLPVEIDPSIPSHQEMAARVRARKALLPFIQRFRPKYMAGWVHEDICRRLERFMLAVERQESPRMLLCMPVRMGKSEIGSRHFAPWILGHHPEWEIIAASGGQNLALSFSRYIRDLVRDPSYQALFPETKLDASSQSAENWSTTRGGGYMAAGIGTMIVGRGAHVLLIDDPCTSPEAADSQVQRDAVWEWYIGAALNRVAPGGGVLGIMTHWNEDDWAGRVQALAGAEGADRFEVVKYPAINDLGDEYLLDDDSVVQIPPDAPVPKGARLTRRMNTPLHPDRYTLKMLLNTKATYYALGNQRWWSALYQQNPTPEGGVFFTKDMFVEYTSNPSRTSRSVYQAWDFAITDKQKSDWTVGVTGYLDENDTLYILDVWRFKTDDGIELGTAIVQYAQLWDAACVAVEDGQIWKSIKANFDKACETKHFYPSYEVIVPLTDKRVRAQPLRGRMQQGKVQFPLRAPWYQEYKAELLRFEGGGRHDDQVDATAHLVRLVSTQAAPRPQTTERLPKSWKEKIKYLGREALGGGHMAA